MANWVDVVALLVIALFVFYGVQKGVMKTFLDVFAVLLAVFFAGQLYRVLSTTIMPFLRVQDLSVYSITFTIFWVIAFAVLELVAGLIMKLMSITFIGYVESLGGALLGLIQGILIMGIAIQLCLMLPISQDIKNIFSSSYSKKISVPTLTKSYSSIFSMFPKIDLFIQQNVVPAIPNKDSVPQTPATPKAPEKLRL